MTDPLIGKFFCEPFYDFGGGGYKGRVLGRAASGDYLVEIFHWDDGLPLKERLIDPSDVRKWSFYPSAIALAVILGCAESESDGQCSAVPTVLIEIAGLATLVRCAKCARFYGGKQRPLTDSDFEPSKPSLEEARLAAVEEIARDVIDNRKVAR